MPDCTPGWSLHGLLSAHAHAGRSHGQAQNSSNPGGSEAAAPVPQERSVAAYGGSFAHVAESVAHRAANLLAATVMVVDKYTFWWLAQRQAAASQ